MMIYRVSILITVFVFGFLFNSCQQSAPDPAENAIARVGNQYLTLQQARKDIPDFALEEDSLGVLQEYREDWIRQQLLSQEANRLGLDQKEEIQEKIQEARAEILRQALKDFIIGSNEEETEVSDEEVRSYYQANKEQFVLDEDFVQFRHMRTQTLEEARAAKQDLLGGVPWPQVAREYATNPKMVLNESDQFWPMSMAAQNNDIMHRYLNIIGQNEISPIQRVDGVYHFVQLIDKREKGNQPDMNWLMGQIKEWMILNKRRRNFSSYVKNLYLKAQSNNEVETFNVLPSKSNQNNTIQDTLENISANE